MCECVRVCVWGGGGGAVICAYVCARTRFFTRHPSQQIPFDSFVIQKRACSKNKDDH